MKKGIVLPFLLLLASVVLIIGAFFVLNNKEKITNQKPTQISSPLPNVDTSNWKTYINKNLGFHLKYPGGTDIYDKRDYVDFIIEPVMNMNVGGGTSIRVEVLENPQNLKLSDIHKEFIGYNCNTEYGGQCQIIIFNSHESLKVQDFIDIQDDLAYYIQRNDKVFRISTQKDKSIPNQILSTLQFIN